MIAVTIYRKRQQPAAWWLEWVCPECERLISECNEWLPVAVKRAGQVEIDPWCIDCKGERECGD